MNLINKTLHKLSLNTSQNLKSNYSKKSYSQSGEDLIVKFIFDAIGLSNPSYIDIGAHHPFYLNNTAIFYELGCRGINIEPDPQLFSLFPKHRKEDININGGVGATEGELILNILNAQTLNTFSAAEAERLVKEYNFEIVNKVPIKVHTIKNVLEKYHNNQFPDFMSLDVEGLDEEIIHTIDYSSTKPVVICLETISYSETGSGQKNHQIIKFLEDKGYMVYADTHINTIFVLKERWVRNNGKQ